MDKRIEQLHAMGCDTAEALERMAGDEGFYIECLQECLESDNFGGLKKALLAGQTQTAFECAHALKGLLGNVGLTPMFRKAEEIVEPLRAGNGSGLEQALVALLEMRETFSEIVA